MRSETFTSILWMVLAMACFALEDVAIKAASASLPISQILILLGFAGAGVFAAWARAQGVPFRPDLATHPAVLARNFAEMMGTVFFVSAISLLPLGLVSAIFQAAPLVVTLGAAVFLGAPVGWRRWSAILVGFVGVLMIVRPGAAEFEPAALLAVGATFFLAMRDLATRKAPEGIPSLILAMYGFGSAGIAGIVLIPLTDPFAWPSALVWKSLAGGLCVGVGGYYAITVAMRAGDIASVTPFRYTRLLFAMTLGFVIFGEIPDGWTLAGATLILGSGLYTLARERRVQR
ncbi:MAG: DMT family transporter [Pseudomonadota bacterium]